MYRVWLSGSWSFPIRKISWAFPKNEIKGANGGGNEFRPLFFLQKMRGFGKMELSLK